MRCFSNVILLLKAEKSLSFTVIKTNYWLYDQKEGDVSVMSNIYVTNILKVFFVIIHVINVIRRVFVCKELSSKLELI